MDPSALTKLSLKSKLSAAGVQLPVTDAKKEVYVQLYRQHILTPQPQQSQQQPRPASPSRTQPQAPAAPRAASPSRTQQVPLQQAPVQRPVSPARSQPAAVRSKSPARAPVPTQPAPAPAPAPAVSATPAAPRRFSYLAPAAGVSSSSAYKSKQVKNVIAKYVNPVPSPASSTPAPAAAPATVIPASTPTKRPIEKISEASVPRIRSPMVKMEVEEEEDETVEVPVEDMEEAEAEEEEEEEEEESILAASKRRRISQPLPAATVTISESPSRSAAAVTSAAPKRAVQGTPHPTKGATVTRAASRSPPVQPQSISFTSPTAPPMNAIPPSYSGYVSPTRYIAPNQNPSAMRPAAVSPGPVTSVGPTPQPPSYEYGYPSIPATELRHRAVTSSEPPKRTSFGRSFVHLPEAAPSSVPAPPAPVYIKSEWEEERKKPEAIEVLDSPTTPNAASPENKKVNILLIVVSLAFIVLGLWGVLGLVSSIISPSAPPRPFCDFDPGSDVPSPTPGIDGCLRCPQGGMCSNGVLISCSLPDLLEKAPDGRACIKDEFVQKNLEKMAEFVSRRLRLRRGAYECGMEKSSDMTLDEVKTALTEEGLLQPASDRLEATVNVLMNNLRKNSAFYKIQVQAPESDGSGGVQFLESTEIAIPFSCSVNRFISKYGIWMGLGTCVVLYGVYQFLKVRAHRVDEADADEVCREVIKLLKKNAGSERRVSNIRQDMKDHFEKIPRHRFDRVWELVKDRVETDGRVDRSRDAVHADTWVVRE